MNLIAELEAEQLAELGHTIPDFKAGDTIRVGYKVTEGSRTRVQNYEGVCIARKNGSVSPVRTVQASPVRSQFARFRLVKAWNVCSHCIQQTSTASPLFAVVASVAPSCTISAHVVVSPRVSPRLPTTKRLRAQKHKGRCHEKRYPPRLPHHRRQNDRWHGYSDEIHLG